VIRGHVLQPEAHKAPHRQRISRAPGDAAFRIDPFEVSDQQQPKYRPASKLGRPMTAA